uniref:Polypeptide N-acetylgalactosaminyltransferase 8 n=1 Tax=Aquila chrysaetos chrysaetos TaxID=223781 RepID=A0A663EG04_AQUCH
MMESVLNCCYNHSSYFQSAKSVEAFRENIKQIAHDLKLQDNSKTEVRKADNAKEEKIVHHLLYPDSVLFKRWGADLREEEQTVAQNLFLSYGYNVHLGDHLPLDRPIKDTRSPSCKTKTYPKDLPTFSIVLLFMNEALSIILCHPGLAAPILSRLKEDPVFDNINFHDTELLQYSVAADGFDWALWCLYERLPAEWYALKDETAPVWPGSVKVKWKLCPVQESLILERAHKPYLLDSSIAAKRNPLRVAEVRMDDYKYILYFAWNLPIENPGIDFGNVSSRKELKKKLNCKGFGWYIKNIYPNLIFLPNIVGYGAMKNTLKEDICIDQGPLPGNTPIIYPNHARSPQVRQATGQIFSYELLLTVPFKPPQGHEIGTSKLLSLCYCVLVSAGMKLIFFLVAGIVLCFGFRMRIMLITC